MQLTHTDITCLARLLNGIPTKQHEWVASVVLGNAQEADHYRRTYGKMHPRYGSGSLMAAVHAYASDDDVAIPSEPPCTDPEWLDLVSRTYGYVAQTLAAETREAA